MDVDELALTSRQDSLDVGVDSGFGGLTLCSLRELQGLKGPELRERIRDSYGSVERLCIQLASSPQKGINGDSEDLSDRRREFGSNYNEPNKPKGFHRFLWEAFKDLTLIILTIAAIVSLGLSFYHPPKSSANGDVEADPTKGLEWIEGAAILSAVVVIVVVTAVNNWSKEKQFRGLKKTIDDNHTFATLRSSEILQLPTRDLVVGDVCLFKYGDTVPADGLIIHSNDVRVDESLLTGETHLVKKSAATDPLLLSGSHVMEGSGRMLVIAVGVNSLAGKVFKLTMTAASEAKTERSKSYDGGEENKGKNDDDDDEDGEFSVKSILRSKLDKLAMQIGYAGLAVALAAFVVLVIRFCVEMFVVRKLPWDSSYIQDFVSFIIISITILVIAIPEGLPLAVMLSLAYSVKKMMADNNLVRHLDACETMGSATTICSDKTGTLTINRMTVVKCFIAQNSYQIDDSFSGFPKNQLELLSFAISVNTNYTSRVIFDSEGSNRISYNRQIGNRTECALLGLLHDLGVDYAAVRQKVPEESFHKVYTFSSVQKRMSTVVPRRAVLANDDGYLLFTKGAAEILVKRCRWIVGDDGEVIPFPVSDQNRIVDEVIAPWSSTGLRTVCVAYRQFFSRSPEDESAVSEDDASYSNASDDFDWDDEESVVSDLTCLCIVGIEDPLRPEVPQAIRRCQEAGITVRMVTGDNVNTARSIAIKCGILSQQHEFLVMEGPEFNQRIRSKANGRVEQELLDQIWPQLRVLARSSPEDKFNLVRGIMESTLGQAGEVVAVTGDGTNDGPALKQADVGFAMGVAGTDFAKEASDIILIDDNFSSIVKAVVWGRNVYDSIAKFLQFQLTVNVVAVSLAFLGACVIADTPLKAVQMMWVNLLQDALASLSLATELPTEEVLQRKPYSRHQSVVSSTMLSTILLHSAYQLTILLYFLFAGDRFFDIDSGRDFDMRGIPTQHFTFIFNVLAVMTLFNEFNCRKLNGGALNVFSGIRTSRIFLAIWISSFFFQIIIVQFGGYAFFTKSLSLEQWLWCLLFGVGELVFAQLIVLTRLFFAYWRRQRCFQETAIPYSHGNAVFQDSSTEEDHQTRIPCVGLTLSDQNLNSTDA